MFRKKLGCLSLKQLVLLAFIIRIGFFYFYVDGGFSQQTAIETYSDSASYIEPAKSLLNEGAFLDVNGQPETNRTPGYPLLITLCMWIANENWVWLLIFLQYVMNIICIYLLHQLLQLFCSDPFVINIGVLICVFNLHDISFCHYVLTDVFGQMVAFTSIYFFVRYLKTFCRRDLIISMPLFALFAFIRPAGLFLPFILTIAVGIVCLSRKITREMVFSILAGIVLGVIPIFCWQARNNLVADYNGFSSNSITTLYYFNSAGIVAFNEGIDFYTAVEKQKNDPEFQSLAAQSSYREAASQLANRMIRENFGVLVLLYLLGSIILLFSPGIFDIIRFSPVFADGIAMSRQLFVDNGMSLAGIETLVAEPIFPLVALSGLVLLLFTCISAAGMMRWLRSKEAWYIRLALIGFFLYFLLICSGPIGIGGFSRYRLSISLLQTFFSAFLFLPKRETSLSLLSYFLQLCD